MWSMGQPLRPFWQEHVTEQPVSTKQDFQAAPLCYDLKWMDATVYAHSEATFDPTEISHYLYTHAMDMFCG